MNQGNDPRDHRLRPLVVEAELAHREGIVRYEGGGGARLRHPLLSRHGLPGEVVVAPRQQLSAIAATFADLDKALAIDASSPRLSAESTLRAEFDAEGRRYRELVKEAQERGAVEPDYGSYVFDPRSGDLYLVAPERWHRLALVACNGSLLRDPEGRLPWAEARRLLEGTVVGFAGVSVGGNILEGWLREARPRAVKIADPDWVEVTNLNRGERMSLRHVVGGRGSASAQGAPAGTPRVSKAEYAAYEAQLVDPYLDCWVYDGGLRAHNLDRFLGGDGGTEPAVDVLVEEMDDLELKVTARQAARQRRIDVLMLSDFGHRPELLWNHFRAHPDSALGFGASDEELVRALEATRSGDPASFRAFAEALCGSDIATDGFADFLAGRGEHPNRGMPQSGATAMASGAIGGKELALHRLGHHRGQQSPCRVIYDLPARTVLHPRGR